MTLATTHGVRCLLRALLALAFIWAGRPVPARADAPATAKQAPSKAKPVNKKRRASANRTKSPVPTVAPPEPAAALPATASSSAQPASPPRAASKPASSPQVASKPASPPPQVTSKPASPPQAAGKVNVPTTSHVHVDVPPGLQAWLDADDRMGPWLAKAVAVTDACYADERAASPEVSGSIAFTLTMHENARPSAAVSSLPAALQGMVLCVTARLMGVKMPLFTGKEGATYTVRVHFEP
jgi:hypothetical protein